MGIFIGKDGKSELQQKGSRTFMSDFVAASVSLT